MLIGAVIKVIINYALRSPNINIKGAAIGTVWLFDTGILNFVAVVRWTAQTTDLNQMVIKPVLASIFMEQC